MKNISPSVCVALLLSSCATILHQPAINRVSEIALVSVYMNKNFYDIGTSKKDQGEIDFNSLLGNSSNPISKLNDSDQLTQAKIRIITHGQKVFFEQLSTIGYWKLLPMKDVAENKSFQNLTKTGLKGSVTNKFLEMLIQAQKNKWVAAPGTQYLSVESLAELAGTARLEFKNGKIVDTNEEARTIVANLCDLFKVDALAIVQLDMGYRSDKLGKVLSGTLAMNTPCVGSRLMVITKDGSVAVDTGSMKRIEGRSSGQIEKGGFTLENEKVASAYIEAVDKAAVALKNTLVPAFKKLK